MNKINNIAAYKFIKLTEPQLKKLKTALYNQALEGCLKGTILLSTEGMNLMLAGEHTSINTFKDFLAQTEVGELTYKETLSTDYPFRRLIVRIKKEIISMGCDTVQPEVKTAPYVTPEILQQWYREKRDMIILDTRNDYEVEMGRFKEAIHLNLKTFREFPKALQALSEDMKSKPVVTYCTGGIRCEKASAFMLAEGFKEVYQLEGGILNYFEQCGSDYFEGKCFVFDDRMSLNACSKEQEKK